MSRLSTALELAAQGFRVFPQDRAKHPCIKAWPTEASSNSEQIERWGKAFPTANFAVALGEGSGAIALDVDIKNNQPGAASLEKMEQEHGKFSTLRVRTGSGGFQLYLRHPGFPVRNQQLVGYPGIEVKGDGGCVTLPGSIYSDGREYKIIENGAIVPCPGWLAELLKFRDPPPQPAEGAEIPAGQRNKYLTRLAGTMRRQGVDEATLLAALTAENEARCNPQLSAAEVQTIAKSIGRYGTGEPKPKQADLAVRLAGSAELFHDEDRAYATIRAEDHGETWRLRGMEFKTWLRRRFYLATETAIGSQALDDALGVLEGKALFAGPQIKTHVRIAGDDRVIYVDLGNPRWQMVKITADGWQVIDEVPVRFRRPRGLWELPAPQAGGNLEVNLEPFLNMEADDRKLFIACLVNAFRPVGPYPVLCLHGEQGSAKSTAAKIFRGCIDPNKATLRTTPREERDLLIAGSNGWVVAFDNLSYLPTWVSDALCRIASGSGFGIRELYLNDEEVLFQVQRPVVLNGIEDIASRGDLLDRSVLVYMPPIAEERRLTERAFMAQFEEALPLILGALLDAVSGAMRHLPEVRLDSVPRMADFCFWVTAAESTLGWEPGSFLRIYRQNREDANSLALEANPIVPELVKLLAAGSWAGTATDLHDTLSNQVSEGKRKSRAWPKSGRMTSASLKRLAPNLRAVGIDVQWEREPGGARTRILRLKVKPCVPSSPIVPIVPKSGTHGTHGDDRTQGYSLSLNAFDGEGDGDE